jgi:acetyl esterase/lipase
VWVHGGGWRNGSKDSGIVRLLPFARRGYVCASIDYRLSGEAIFPAQIEDCKCALRYLRAHAAELRLDPERIGAWGSSAGGHLVALLGTTGAGNAPDLEGSGGWAEHSSRVQAVCDWYGPTDFLQISRFPTTIDREAPNAPEAQLIGGLVQEHPDRVARANPITYVTGHEPPFLIVHGDQDAIVPHNQSVLLYDALGSTDVTFHTLVGAGHGGPQFDHPATLQIVAEFFDRHLRPSRSATSSGAENGQVAANGAPSRRSLEKPQMVTLASRLWVNPDAAPPLATYQTFQSAAAGGPVGYALYLPPDYERETTRRYPIIYWLHGRGGDPRRGATFVKMLDEAIKQGIAPPAIAVLVTGGPNSMYVDAKDGSWPVETVIIRELIPHVDATYRTIASREARAIEGQSMGGFGAARIGFGYPDLFGTVSLSAGAYIEPARLAEGPRFHSIYGGDRAYLEETNPWNVVRRNATQIRGRTLVRVFVGDQDRLLENNRRYHALLDELGIAHEFTVVPGAEHSYDDKVQWLGLGHFAFWAAAFERAADRPVPAG